MKCTHLPKNLGNVVAFSIFTQEHFVEASTVMVLEGKKNTSYSNFLAMSTFLFGL